jgi:hypothetical protein
MTDRIYIYALRECGSDEVRYVGQTDSPETRFRSHKRDGDIDSRNFKSAWIGDVLARGSDIEMVHLEECSMDDSVERENLWIRHYRDAGHPLTNAHYASSPPRKRVVAPVDMSANNEDEEPTSYCHESTPYRDADITDALGRIENILRLMCEHTGVDLSDLPENESVVLARIEKKVGEVGQKMKVFEMLPLIYRRLSANTEVIDGAS